MGCRHACPVTVETDRCKCTAGQEAGGGRGQLSELRLAVFCLAREKPALGAGTACHLVIATINIPKVLVVGLEQARSRPAHRRKRREDAHLPSPSGFVVEQVDSGTTPRVDSGTTPATPEPPPATNPANACARCPSTWTKNCHDSITEFVEKGAPPPRH